MFILPYRVKVYEERIPTANYILVGTTCALSLLFGITGLEFSDSLVLRGIHPVGLLGHMFLHGDWIHLVGNMVFLLVFGNAVCAKLGQWKYLLVYFLSGLGAALAHVAIDGDPAVGASGAISGVMAAYVVLFPWNRVSCKWAYGFHYAWRTGEFEVRGFWLIGLWAFLDLWWAVLSDGIIAHWAHLGGYASGFGLIVLLVLLDQVEFRSQDRPLVGADRVPEERQVIVTEATRIAPSKVTSIGVAASGPQLPELPPGPLRLTDEERRALGKPGRIVRGFRHDVSLSGSDHDKRLGS